MLPRTPTISLDGLRTSSRLLSEAHNARTMCWKPISFTHCRPVVHRTQRRVAQHLQGVAQNAPAAVVLRKTPPNHGSTTRGKACHITSNKRCLIHVEGGTPATGAELSTYTDRNGPGPEPTIERARWSRTPLHICLRHWRESRTPNNASNRARITIAPEEPRTPHPRCDRTPL